MRKLSEVFKEEKALLSVFFTAGYTGAHTLSEEILFLQNSGVDFVEAGIPFSDPLADGEVIQESSSVALKNGTTLEKIMEELISVKDQLEIPVVMMGYLNSILAYGIKKFLKQCNECGITSVILPDMTPEIYLRDYEIIFLQYNIKPVFLITPETSKERMRLIESVTGDFIYAVSSSCITGGVSEFTDAAMDYFKRIKNYGFIKPVMTGFGIHNNKTFRTASEFSHGCIIGSAYIKSIQKNERKHFLMKIRS